VTVLNSGCAAGRHFAEQNQWHGIWCVKQWMSAPSDRPGLNAFMEAYAVLGVEYTASPLDIRKAFRLQARQHHPDRFPPGSPEQHQATQRMTALNSAYQLVRDAPLRHHRISTGARPDDPWTDDELDAAVRRSRSDVALSKGIGVALSALGVGLYLLVVARPSGWHLAHPIVGVLLFWAMYFLAVQTPAGLHLWRIIDLFHLGTFVLRRLSDFR
jgi:hypothetical protein